MKKNNIYYNYFPARNAFHLAAIIPVSGQPLDFNMPWSDCLMPIAKDYLAVERAVFEALYAGSDTIWIVADEHTNPLLRKRIGELAYSPKSLKQFKDSQKIEVPIYYVSTNPKDYNIRNSLAWAILYGASTCYNIYNNLSKWVVPTKFLVTFPHAVYPADVISKCRSKIFQPHNFYISYNGATVKNNNYTAFTFEYSEIKEYVKFIKDNEALGFKDKPLRVADRYTGRYFTLEEVFGIKEINKEKDEFQEIPWYYNIDNWEDYCVFLSSPERKDLEIPEDGVFTRKKWYGMGIDNEEIEEENE